VLAVKVDFETRLATIGTQAGSEVPADEISESLKTLGYSCKVVKLPKRE
jgi:hypothetical protein